MEEKRFIVVNKKKEIQAVITTNDPTLVIPTGSVEIPLITAYEEDLKEPNKHKVELDQKGEFKQIIKEQVNIPKVKSS